jgi:hypothetical protein
LKTIKNLNMKNDKKAVLPGLREKKGIPENISNKNSAKKSKNGVVDSSVIASAVGKTKAKSGGGLANEGTVVSYDEER